MRKRAPLTLKRRTQSVLARAAARKFAVRNAMYSTPDEIVTLLQKMKLGASKRLRVSAGVSKVATNHKITEYFPARKSTRKTKKQLDREVEETMQEKIVNGSNEALLQVFKDPVKGRGLRTTVAFEKDDFVIEYKGDMILHSEARAIEARYSLDEKIGSYMFFFEFEGRKWCVDATAETKYKGRLVNHSFKHPNLKAKVIKINNTHYLILAAKHSIEIGEELLYDYGDRSSEVIANNPWLRSS
ncbi:hypothetical protein B9Z55_022098 [Caenorhabditis nigoni]|uniref:[histone H4]-lysine(20) N-methyltransferase n=1 Tax=Caenorhabditis nigoni TaxID=1611254 RepID=A0A2G5TUY9_9PELO|nr:hypothetical protein B9Z55_022098 [Caenorhabditis nigoni]